MTSKSQRLLSIIRVQKLAPPMAQCLLRRSTRVVIIALIKVHRRAIWLNGPHELRHRFGQHTRVLLAGFDPLLRPFLVLDVGAGAKPFEGRALIILVWHGSGKEPAIAPCAALLDAVLHFIRGSGPHGNLPRLLNPWSIIRVDELDPVVPLDLFRCLARIVTPALVRVFSSAIGAHHPDKMGDAINERPQFVFGSLAFADIPTCTDEILDLLAGIPM